jgi:enoyl-CoA hydratase/carnithine racemase
MSIVCAITSGIEAMASQSVLLNMHGSVATITLNRPEILNAIDLSMRGKMDGS